MQDRLHNPCVRSVYKILAQILDERSFGKIAVGDRYTRSVHKLSIGRLLRNTSLRKIPARDLYQIPTQGIPKRSPHKIFSRDVCTSLHKVSKRDLCTRSLQSLKQDLCKRTLGQNPGKRSLFKVRVGDLCQRSLDKISPRSVYRRSFSRFAHKLAKK